MGKENNGLRALAKKRMKGRRLNSPKSSWGKRKSAEKKKKSIPVIKTRQTLETGS